MPLIDLESRKLPPEILAHVEAKFGMNRPLGRQYVDYLAGVSSELDLLAYVSGDSGHWFKLPPKLMNRIYCK